MSCVLFCLIFFYYLMVHSFVNAKVSHRNAQKKFKQNVRLKVFHFNVSAFSCFFRFILFCACEWFIVHINLLVGCWNIFSICSAVFALEITTFIHCWAKNFICGFWFCICITLTQHSLNETTYIKQLCICSLHTQSVNQLFQLHVDDRNTYPSIWIYISVILKSCVLLRSLSPWECVNKILTNHHCDLESYVAKQYIARMCVRVNAGNVIAINQMHLNAIMPRIEECRMIYAWYIQSTNFEHGMMHMAYG